MCGLTEFAKQAAPIIQTVGAGATTAYALMNQNDQKVSAPQVTTAVSEESAAEKAAAERRRLLALRGKSSTIKTPWNLGPAETSSTSANGGVRYSYMLGGR